MSHQNYTIFGKVVDQTGQGVPAVEVIVDTTDPSFANLDPATFSIVTDSQGEYALALSAGMLTTMFTDSSGVEHTDDPIGVLFTLKSATDQSLGTLGREISQVEISLGAEQDFTVTIEDEACCCPPKKQCEGYSVYGTISTGDDTVLDGLEVRVHSREFRSNVILGRGVVDEFGHFDFNYPEDAEDGDPCDPRGPGLELYTTVVDLVDENTILASSKLELEPGFRQEFAIILDSQSDAITQYASVIARLRPHMEGRDPEAIFDEGLQAQDIEFLGERSGLDRHTVQRFVSAMAVYSQWVNYIPTPTEVDIVPREAMYAWLVRGQSEDLVELARLGPEQLRLRLRRAIADGVIRELVLDHDPQSGDPPPPSLEDICNAVVKTVFWDIVEDTSTMLGRLLALGAFSGSAEQQRESKRNFLIAYADRQGDLLAFYGGYADAHLDKAALQLQISLAGLTGGHLPLVTQLIDSDPDATLSTLHRLATKTKADWLNALSGLDAPANFPGSTPAIALDNYATALRRSFEHAYPEVSVLQALAEGTDCATPASCPSATQILGICPCALLELVLADPTLRLRDTVIDDHFAVDPNDDTTPDQTLRDKLAALELVQRLWAIVPDFDAAAKIRALIDAGLHSAQQITRSGRDRFVDQFAAVMGSRANAKFAYTRAEQVDAAVTHLVATASPTLRPGFHGMDSQVATEVDQSQSPSVRGPTLEKIFGRFDVCICDHCQSILSPAAYLVDTLEFIGERGLQVLGCACSNPPNDPPRRPDICEIDLDCSNTLTPLPHIDIVNELLKERVIWANGGATASGTRQTTWTAEQLRAHPEHLDATAYEALRSIEQREPGTAGRAYFAATRPWILPFDLFLEESREYLEQLGTTRRELLQLCKQSADDDQLVREHLGLGPASAQLLTDGQKPAIGDAAERARAATMAWLGDPTAPGYVADLGKFVNARDFFAATGLEPYRAFEVVDTHWAGRIESEQSRVQVKYATDAPCDLSSATLEQDPEKADFWPERLARVHRFVRLLKHLQIHREGRFALSIDELDEALQKLSLTPNAALLDSNFLARLAELNDLRARFDASSVVELLTWWGDIEARPDKYHYVEGDRVPRTTLYQRLFLDPSSDPGELVREAFELTPVQSDGGFQLEGTVGNDWIYDDSEGADNIHLPLIASALGLAIPELISLIEKSGLETRWADDLPILNLRNLSLLYMRASVARALGIDTKKLLQWERVTDLPLSETSSNVATATGNVPRLMAEIDRITALGITADELDFILHGTIDADGDFRLPPTQGFRVALEALAVVAEARRALPRSAATMEGSSSAPDKLHDLLAELKIPQFLGHPIDRAKIAVIVRGVEGQGPPGFQTEADWRNYVDTSLEYYPQVFRSKNQPSPLPGLYDGHLGLTIDRVDLEADINRPELRAERFIREILNFKLVRQLENALPPVFADALGIDLDIATAIARFFEPQSLLETFTEAFEFNEEDLQLDELNELLAISNDDEFFDRLFMSDPVRLTLYGNMQSLVSRMQMAALLVARLSMSAGMTEWLAIDPISADLGAGPHSARLGLLSPTSLGTTSHSYGEFLRLTQFLSVSGTVFAQESRWMRLISNSLVLAKSDGVQVEAADLQYLAQSAGWDEDEIVGFAGSMGPRSLTYGELRDFEAVLELARSVHLGRELVVPLATMAEWIADNSSASEGEVTQAQAELIKVHAKSRYSESQWPNAIQVRRDRLRARQRDALLAYVENYADYDRENYDIYAWTLIDPEMSPCAPTSRVKAAVASLQLLISRWYLGLELGANANADIDNEGHRREWEWRSRYRIWEAQRKLYLYPENWLDPALRDDKTELFADFEDTLRSAELTEANVENALKGYLRGLNDVARLEISGLYHEKEAASDAPYGVHEALHVFGRTRGQSGACYYRRQDIYGKQGSSWSPWTKLPFEIDARDVLPVVYNRRLMVLWPRFELRDDASALGQDARDEKPSRQHYRVALAWSELLHGDWSEPKQSEAFLLVVSYKSFGARPDFDDLSPELISSLINLDMAKDSMGTPVFRPVDANDITLHHRFSADGKLLVNVRFEARFDPETRRHNVGSFEFGGCDGDVAVNAVHTWSINWQSWTKFRPFEATRERQGFFGHGNVFASDLSERPVFWNCNPEREFETINPRPYFEASEKPWLHTFYQDDRHNLYLRGTEADSDCGYANCGSLARALTADLLAYSTHDLRVQARDSYAAPPTPPRVAPSTTNFDIDIHYHPYACLMTSQVDAFGSKGLYRPTADPDRPETIALVRQQNETPLFGCNEGYRFGADIPPALYQTSRARISSSGLREHFEFSAGSPYGIYNWELFYHIPMHVARELAAHRQFSAALQWLSYIFDPTARGLAPDPELPDDEGVDFWRFKPFENQPPSLQSLLEQLADGQTGDDAAAKALRAAIVYADQDPFNPHGVARLRHTPYQIATVLEYVKTLLAWGDHLFRQGSIESINEATQLFVLAHTLLGDRPVGLPKVARDALDYCELRAIFIDETGNSMVEIEDRLLSAGREAWSQYPIQTPEAYGYLITPPIPVTCDPLDPGAATEPVAFGGRLVDPPTGIDVLEIARPAQPRALRFQPASSGDERALYFCVPPNEALFTFWDRVDDRLFKIRHCLDINGNPRAFRLFEPPIDPGALVEAVAGGGNLSDALDDLATPPPLYRFTTHLALAQSLAKELEGLGAQLLAALEKRDTQHLVQLRASHEVTVLERAQYALESRVTEAEESMQALLHARAGTVERIDFYENREARNASESNRERLLNVAAIFKGVAAGLSGAAGGASLVPEIRGGVAGLPGSPVVTAQFGGSNFKRLFSGIASAIQSSLGAVATRSQAIALQAEFERRDEDWEHALAQARLDLELIDSELRGAELRLEIAQRELERHRQQRKNSDEVNHFLTYRFTGEALFSWMARELSTIFYETYQLAFDFAKRAEQCYRTELVAAPTSAVDFGTWKGGRKGLLSGERLTQQLRQLEADYQQNHARELELHESVSLRRLDRAALERLRVTGACEFHVPETLFDLDHPGHYLRRIKTVSASIPCTKGTFDNVNATLTLVHSSVRRDLPADLPPSDDESQLALDRFGATHRIATSECVADSGMFEANLNDARYLPFEHRGVISSWRLELPKNYRAFDYSSIADVVLDMRYTARDGGEVYRQAVIESLPTRLSPSALPRNSWPEDAGPWLTGISAKMSFPREWEAFMSGRTPTLDIAGIQTVMGLPQASTQMYFAVRQSAEQGSFFAALAINGDAYEQDDDTRVALWTPVMTVGHNVAHDAQVTLDFQINNIPLTPEQKAQIDDVMLFVGHQPTIAP